VTQQTSFVACRFCFTQNATGGIVDVCPVYPHTIDQLAIYIGQPNLTEYVCRFLYDQSFPNTELCGMDVHIDTCPEISSTQIWVKVFHSATSTYYAPSDLASIRGMHWEMICATLCWKGGPGHYDCVYVEKDANARGFCGLHIVCVKLFFSFLFQEEEYSCTLVEWFSTYGNSPCEDMGLWMVEPDYNLRGK
jgi:hypothetical protein